MVCMCLFLYGLQVELDGAQRSVAEALERENELRKAFEEAR